MKIFLQLLSLLLCFGFYSCKSNNDQENKKTVNSPKKETGKTRMLADTIGFAQYDWQMDSIISRIDAKDKVKTDQLYKAVINPHDDYAYAAGLYHKTLSGIKAKTILLIGVAHRARNFNLENRIIFGSFDNWKGPYGSIKISPLRNELAQNLKAENYIVHDSMMQLEHSLEAITPFLQKNNKEVEIIPVLIPYMTFTNMEAFSEDLADNLKILMSSKNMDFGKDLAIVISNDAIHYGDEDWGGSNLAPFGSDSLGNEKARQKDLNIIAETLNGELSSEKIKTFNRYTVKEADFKEYNWTWCGRYSVPFGLLTANKLNKKLTKQALNGQIIDYRSSLHNAHLTVEDLGMGNTAPANRHHWVGYVGMAYN